MPGFNTLPAVGGGGGQANMTFVASVHMQTYNRSWAQGGTAGYYGLFSVNQENGYAYFVGSGVSTGVPLNRLNNITHAFTRIDIIAPTNDMISLYKAKVKATTVLNNPFDADPSIGKLALNSYPGIVTASGNFVLPNNALPLVNVLVCGAGGGAYHHSGGGAGGNVIKLTAIQAVGTTGVTIGSSAFGNATKGGDTYFGNVYALGGGSSSDANNNSYSAAAGNGAGIGKQGTHSGTSAGFPGVTQTTNTGLGTVGSPAFFGGNRGGGVVGSFSPNHGGGGGGGAGGVGTDRTSTSMAATGGPGHQSDITGSNLYYGSGGGGSHHMTPAIDGSASTSRDWGYGANSLANTNSQYGGQGVVVVRYYIS